MSDTSEIIRSGAAEKLADIIHKLAGPLAEEVGLLLGDKAKIYRLKNWLSVVNKTKAILDEAGLPANAVPPRMFLPIAEASSLENDETLQTLWAGLLASASDTCDSLSPAFIDTLKQLTPGQAKVLESAFQKFPPVTNDSRTSVHFHLVRDPSTDRAQFQLLSDSFERLGLVRREYELSLSRRDFGGIERALRSNNPQAAISQLKREIEKDPELDYEILFTGYSLEFMRACRGPKTGHRTGDDPRASQTVS